MSRRSDSSLYYSADFWDLEKEELAELLSRSTRPQPTGPRRPIGTIRYANDVTANLTVQTEIPGASYDVHVEGQQNVEGLHVPSHRAMYSYQQVQSIPTVPRRRNEAFNHYTNLIRSRFRGEHTQWSPHYYMKETLIALANFGYGNKAMDADPESQQIFEEFQDVLRRMLPPKLGFKNLRIRVPEVVLETETGPFSIDALSGGMAAIIDLAWQVFMYQPSGKEFVVTLDEPENHLHPELQRRVLTDLVNAFPTVQFIVATHSPFIVGSVPQSNVYVLDYDETGKVNSALLDTVNRAGSANEILREVLGLEYTMPVWVETELEGLVRRYSDLPFTNETVASLRRDMAALGLAKHVPHTIAKLAEKKDAES
jgi:hypothetical protein